MNHSVFTGARKGVRTERKEYIFLGELIIEDEQK